MEWNILFHFYVYFFHCKLHQLYFHCGAPSKQITCAIIFNLGRKKTQCREKRISFNLKEKKKQMYVEKLFNFGDIFSLILWNLRMEDKNPYLFSSFNKLTIMKLKWKNISRQTHTHTRARRLILSHIELYSSINV